MAQKLVVPPHLSRRDLIYDGWYGSKTLPAKKGGYSELPAPTTDSGSYTTLEQAPFRMSKEHLYNNIRRTLSLFQRWTLYLGLTLLAWNMPSQTSWWLALLSMVLHHLTWHHGRWVGKVRFILGRVICQWR